MTTLIVLLPPRDPAVSAADAPLPELPFVLFGKHGRPQRSGRAAPTLLPKAAATVLLVAARDLLLVAAALPPVRGARLRQVLPNAVEEQLIQDQLACHFAVDPVPLADGRRAVAVIDREWFRRLVDAFVDAGHRALRAVPLQRCLPLAPPQTSGEAAAADASAPDTFAAAPSPPLTALLLGPSAAPSSSLPAELQSASARPPSCDVVFARGADGALGEGLAVPADALAATLAALAGDGALTTYRLVDVPGAAPCDAPLAAPAQPLSFDALARRALDCRFDLCQFEFAAQAWRAGRASLRRWRLPIALAAATLLVTVAGVNLQWMMLSRQRDALVAQQTELLLTAFPKTAAVLDPPVQMARQMQQLRRAAGELSADDFLAQADAVARSLAPLPQTAVAALDYRDRALSVTFKPGIAVDAGFAARLASAGFDGRADPAADAGAGTSGSKWIIRSSR